MDPEKENIMSHSQLPDHDFKSSIVPNPPSTATSPNSSDPNPQHTLFCRMIGLPVDFETAKYPSIWNVFSRKERAHKGLYTRVRVAYQWHTFQYWLVATMSNALLWMQICFGAILTALGGLRDVRVSVVIMVLGALQTIYGGLITYFKSRGQPNRARQFRIAIKHTLDAIENAEELLRDPNYQPPPYKPGRNGIIGGQNQATEEWSSVNPDTVITGVEGMVIRLMVKYFDAIREAEANYPDLWIRSNRTDDQGQTPVMQNILDELRKSGAASGPGGTNAVNANPISTTTPSDPSAKPAQVADSSGVQPVAPSGPNAV